jgi:hypothetical protein
MRKVIPTAFALALVACGTNAPPENEVGSRCLQTYEFGNTGCAELTGLVSRGEGVPAQAFVNVQGPAQPGRSIVLVSGYVGIDSTGLFRLRVIRYAGEVPTAGPDTVTVWVRAAVPPPSDAPTGTPGPSDSVLTTLELRPVGEEPVVTQVGTIVVPE